MQEQNFNKGINKVKLKDLGFTEAGKSSGNGESFKNYLDLIFNGKIIDESISIGLTELEVRNIEKQIEDEEAAIKGFNSEKETIKKRIETCKSEIEVLEKERIDIISGKKALPFEGGRFNPLKFGINSFFLLMLSIYLFLFYVATVYKGLFVDVADIARIIGETGKLPSGLPDPEEMWIALSNNIVVIFAPFIFYAFGYAVHVFLEQKSKTKYIWIALVILITFILDFLIAYKIHEITNEAIVLSGGESTNWNSSPTFFIIIFMGFVVYIIWSILFHAWMTEWSKRDITGRIDDSINELKKQIKKLQEQLGTIDLKISEKESNIKKLRNSLTDIKIPVSDIKFCIAEFSAGWLQFLSGTNTLEQTRKECQIILEQFQKERF